MYQRQSTASKSVFYRGISLKEYLRKASEFGPSLQYKDDQTIFLDQNHSPVLISDSFIHKEIGQQPRLAKKRENLRVPTQQSQESEFHLPLLKTKRIFQVKQKDNQTQRNSTDTSIGGATDTSKLEFPTLKNSSTLKDEQELLSNRTSTQNSIFKVRQICNRHCSQLSKDSEDKMSKGRSLSNRKYVEMIRNQVELHQRYLIKGKSSGGKLGSKNKNISRIYSFIQ